MLFGCAEKKAPSVEAVFYEMHPTVPDVGAALGLPLLYQSHEEGVDFYYYPLLDPISDALERFETFCIELGHAGKREDTFFSLPLSGTELFLTSLTLEEEGETRIFLVAMVGDLSGKQ